MEEAVSRLAVLGSGFRVVTLRDRTAVISQPQELNSDHMAIFEAAKVWTQLEPSSFFDKCNSHPPHVRVCVRTLLLPPPPFFAS